MTPPWKQVWDALVGRAWLILPATFSPTLLYVLAWILPTADEGPIRILQFSTHYNWMFYSLLSIQILVLIAVGLVVYLFYKICKDAQVGGSTNRKQLN